MRVAPSPARRHRRGHGHRLRGGGDVRYVPQGRVRFEGNPPTTRRAFSGLGEGGWDQGLKQVSVSEIKPVDVLRIIHHVQRLLHVNPLHQVPKSSNRGIDRGDRPGDLPQFFLHGFEFQ